MPCKDGRRNALVKKQRWIEMQYIDNISMEEYIKDQIKNKHSIYGFSGQSLLGNIRIDFRKNSNANLIGDLFELLKDIPDNSVDVFIIDPPFELYNPNLNVWLSLIKKGMVPLTWLNSKSKLLGHPNLWQQEIFKKVKPGGIMISKRNIANVYGLSKIPQLFYVHDTRPMAHIVRIDHK